ncbi:MAG: PEGA domain-containing protein [Bdellovibrionaceae bacterium]|nr:PEGA domain-containing protein [Pseudobdellovibrionaceae bacterium]
MLKIIAILAMCLQLGCASIMKEEWEEIFIKTNPPGAEVAASNGESCFTPCHLELDRKISVDLTLKKEGFEEEKYNVNGKSIDPWLWGNLIFLIGFPIAVGVDFYTGYAYDFSPSKIELDLKKK